MVSALVEGRTQFAPSEVEGSAPRSEATSLDGVRPVRCLHFYCASRNPGRGVRGSIFSLHSDNIAARLREREIDMPEDKGLVQIPSHYSVDESIRRLQSAFEEKMLKVFAVIDHSGEAEKVGLTMRPTKVLIFGNPKGGTPLMVAAPSLAIDLPLKALVAEGPDGKVSVTYNSADYLQHRHGVPAELIRNLAGAAAVIAKAVE